MSWHIGEHLVLWVNLFSFISWFLIWNLDCNYLSPMLCYFVFHYYLARCLSLLFLFSDLCFNLVIIGWIPSKCTMDGSFLNASPSWTEIGLILICGNLLNTEMNCFSLTLLPKLLNIYIYIVYNTHTHIYPKMAHSTSCNWKIILKYTVFKK